MCAYIGWDENTSPHPQPGESLYALNQIFAHLCSQVIDRINRAPEKNFLAFLDLLGNTLTPAAPARVPLSFSLSSSATDGVLLPVGTRVFASPPAGASEPVYFETEANLWLTIFELKKVLTGYKEPYDDLSLLINNSGHVSEALFNNSHQTYRFGFELIKPRQLPVGSAVTLYFDIKSPTYDPNTGITHKQRLTWTYSTVAGAKPLYVEDHTQQLTVAGHIIFEVPDDFSRSVINPEHENFFWIQVEKTTNGQHPALLNWLATNTDMATQAATISDEILGSSTGNPGQTFNTFNHPVLPGQRLQIKENAAGANDSQSVIDDWQLWQEVKDFYASNAGDRHYVLDHNTGQITFGNGQNGMIPPVGVRNIKVQSYRYGGGLQGNVAAGAISNFWSPLSHVDKVTNYNPATGGSDVETYASLLDRAPKILRHRNRAVSESDYEDLAKMATTEVAVARCVPLADLAENPYQEINQKDGVGKVSLIIVPKSNDPIPTPTQALINRVKDYIVPLAPSIVTLSVVGPLYLPVNVTINVRITDLQLENTVKKTIQSKLAEFLHPLTGRNNKGWPFGREPHESDFYNLLNNISGVEFIESIGIELEKEDSYKKKIWETQRFLICSGDHDITTNGAANP